MTDGLITIVRRLGGEAEGPMDSLASDLLARAGFVRRYTLRGIWHRIPFGMGVEWQNEHASQASEMLRAAHYPVHLPPRSVAGVRPVG
ncbi:hypothetical protein ACFCWD_22710 [Streptomyces sp. NPDC056374]|uniref:hypothetical protein n=1 Tax=unclassified Streptomyces TaxID=2593676 RepID=UPI0035D547AA